MKFGLFSKVSVMACILTMCGCAPSQSTPQQLSLLNLEHQEGVYQSTNDYPKLIELYKSSLSQEDRIETRLKLVQAYIDMGDVESAEFHLGLLGTSQKYQSQISYLHALVCYQKAHFGAAVIHAKEAMMIGDTFPEAEHLLGLIYASMGEYEEARHYFYMARQHFVDDVKIKNNLAMIDILEGNYSQAIYRLEPLLANSDVDEQVRANLALAYAKSGDFLRFRTLYVDIATDAELQQAYSLLQSTTSKMIGSDDAVIQ